MVTLHWKCVSRLVDPTGRAKVRTVVKGRGMLGEIARFSEPVGVLAEEVEAHLGNLLKEVVSLRNAAESGAPRDRRAAQLDPHTQLQIHRYQTGWHPEDTRLALVGALQPLMKRRLAAAVRVGKFCNLGPLRCCAVLFACLL